MLNEAADSTIPTGAPDTTTVSSPSACGPASPNRLTWQVPPTLVTVPIAVTGGMVGTQKNYQLIFRDLQAFLSLGVSNAVHVEFCP